MNTQLTISEESLLAIYPYRDNKGRHILEESIEDYAERTNQTIRAVQGQADRGTLPVIQTGRYGKRKINLYAIFLQTIIHAEKYVLITK
ncbi:TPA: DNA-binding protein [Escherichia coli]